MQVYIQRVGANGPPELLFRSPEAQNSDDWSRDGRHMLFSSQSPTNARDLWAIPVDASARTPMAVAQTGAEERNGAFSDDGAWVAYQSDETGTNEVYVRPFPDQDARGVSPRRAVSPRHISGGPTARSCTTLSRGK